MKKVSEAQIDLKIDITNDILKKKKIPSIQPEYLS